MKKQDKRNKATAEPPSEGMSIDEIASTLATFKEMSEDAAKKLNYTPDAVNREVLACEAATDILTALQDEGINDPEQVRDLIHDYNALAEQYQKMHQRYEEPAQVLRLGGGARAACLCPECHNQSRPGNAYCWNCGKRLDWRRRP